MNSHKLVNMIKKSLVKAILIFSGSFLVFLSIFISEPQITYAANPKGLNKEQTLLKKVSNDYTKKFCNGIGFGLSKQSAMTFAMKENKQTFANKKGIDQINKEELAEKIATSVIESCGYPIDLAGEKGINEFREFFLAMEENIKLN